MHACTRRVISTGYAVGAVHNFKLFRDTLKILPPRAWIVADKGYQGIQYLRAQSLLPTKATRSRPIPKPLKVINRAIQ